MRRLLLGHVLLFAAAVAVGHGSVLGQDAQPPDEWWAGIDTISPGVTVLFIDSLYPVAGVTEAEIGAELNSRGPVKDGRRFHGLSQNTWRYQYRLQELGSGACRTQSLTVIVRAVLTLPHLSSGSQTPEALVGAFRKYVGYLRVHEEGHQVIARTKLYEFRAAVEGTVYLNCDQARRSISAMSEDLAANLGVLQASYDDDTDHGRTQGATWPPRDSGHCY